ncbi:MAG: NADH-quinone oxidoreductase subunit H [Acidimicrobiales bacterium]|nr:NADH-quinone oxidoreductase subunit H [Acidimicrobiales bacterium]
MLVVVVIVPTAALIFGYVFLFKMMSHMQSRLGPMEAGPHGTLQLLADGVKFLQKEDVFPDQADRRVFALAPLVVMMGTFLLFAVIPAGPDLVIESLDTGVFFALAATSISVIGVLMAGWASANKYSLLGGLRAAGQLIAYELPLVFAVIGVVIQAGSLNLQTIVTAQADGAIFGFDLVGLPYVVPQIIGFVIFMIAAQAELTQTPFDMPVAESEVVGGYHVEYTGFRFLFFFLAEFGTAFALAAVGATLFLGGWGLPNVDLDAGWMNLVGPAVLFAKIMLLAFIIFWVRFSYPRFREDQLQKFAWKWLVQLALLNILLTGLFKVVF